MGNQNPLKARELSGAGRRLNNLFSGGISNQLIGRESDHREAKALPPAGVSHTVPE